MPRVKVQSCRKNECYATSTSSDFLIFVSRANPIGVQYARYRNKKKERDRGIVGLIVLFSGVLRYIVHLLHLDEKKKSSLSDEV